ncbi:hypothetical protein [Streptomyces chattanoogensis]|uniref:hypothetical protein n=1 Tax=Streptomyces chattanoogensis TaxID=66876 RepID=UPI0036742EE3
MSNNKVVSVKGGKVHFRMNYQGGYAFPACRTGAMTNSGTKYQITDQAVDCRTCLSYDAEAFAEYTPELEDVNENGESETMAKNDVTTEDGANVIEQIDANIERAASLAEAENVDALKELDDETEALISSLSGKGSIALKKGKRDAFKAAAQGTPKRKAEPKAEVATRETQDYTQVEGVSELVNEGAEKFAEGVRLHVKTHEIAADISRVILDQRVRISNKDGLPDLKAASNAAKAASKDMYKKAGDLYRASGAASDEEVEKAMSSLIRSVQNQSAKTIATYLVELEQNPKELERFAEIPHPGDGQTWAEVIATHYGLSSALAKIKAIEAGESEGEGEEGGAEGGEGGGEGEAHELTDAQKIAQLFTKAESQLEKAVKTAKKVKDDEEKEMVKTHIDSLIAELAKLSASL